MTASAHLSAFELFRIGIGPSSSHTVGPMRAAARFLAVLGELAPLGEVERLTITLFGSLAATGRGHGTDRAVLLGLEGEEPDAVQAGRVDSILADIAQAGVLQLGGQVAIGFELERDLVFEPRQRLAFHPNAVRFAALMRAGGEISRDYYSVGGGFVLSGSEAIAAASPGEMGGEDPGTAAAPACPFPFTTAAELLVHCARERESISGIMRANEQATRTPGEVDAGLLRIWAAMEQCIAAGCATGGVLPGGLGVPRRARAWHEALSGNGVGTSDPLAALDWVSLWALAVNEENAAGHRVVTAPTNGAAGVVPAVLNYYRHFVPGADDAGSGRFLLAAAAIGSLIKRNASIAGAEVGCQGEVGTACAMAAAGLTEVSGGSPLQVENAAEIAMEHNLGLTCDPVAGLVQIPCIERNAIAAVKAISASRMALRGDGRHTVSLDVVIATMRQTGLDMNSKYKETAEGGLAVNLIEC